MGDVLPKIRVAAVQMASVLYDREKTLEKMIELIKEAASNGAEMVAFPESCLPGYPYYLWKGAPKSYAHWYKQLYLNAVEVPSRTTDILCRAAKQHGVDLVVGITEREHNTLFNCQIFINRKGELLGRHRKIMPTHAERTCWSNGDGSDLRTWDYDQYRLSGLLCWEHMMDLTRYAMYTERPQIHVAAWVGGSAMAPWTELFNLSSELCARYHAHVGECFVVNVQGVLDKDGYELLTKDAPEYEADNLRVGGGWSAIIAPGGVYLAEPLIDKEGIIYADCDFEMIVDMAHFHDNIGHYARPDLLSLNINKTGYNVANPMELAGSLPNMDGIGSNRSNRETEDLREEVSRLRGQLEELQGA